MSERHEILAMMAELKLAGMRASYDEVVIDESKGERWFGSEAEAEAAGFSRAGNCPKQ